MEVVILMVLGTLQGVVIYLVIDHKTSNLIDGMSQRLLNEDLRITILEAKLKQEQEINEKLNSALMVLERTAKELQARLSVVSAENRELKQLVSHGGRVIRQAVGNNLKGTAVIINSDAIKGFLKMIKLHGLEDYE